MVAEKAGAPGTPTVDKVGKNSVDLSWTKPRNDGGSKIKGMIIYMCHYCTLLMQPSVKKILNTCYHSDKLQTLFSRFIGDAPEMFGIFVSIRIHCQEEEEGISGLGAR